MDGYKVTFDSVDIQGQEGSIIFEPVLGCSLVEGGTGHPQGEYSSGMRDELVCQNQVNKPVPLSRRQRLRAHAGGAAAAAVQAHP